MDTLLTYIKGEMDNSSEFRISFLRGEKSGCLKDSSVLKGFINDLVHEFFKCQKCVEPLRISTGSLLERPDHEVFPGKYKEEDFIFLISEYYDTYENDFPEEMKLKMWEEIPNLSRLLFKECHPYERYFVKGTTLIYHVPFHNPNYKLHQFYFKKKLPIILASIQEMKNLNFSYDFVSKVIENTKNSCKSKVSHINPAFRHRKSPYPMISVDEALHLVLKESCPMKKTETLLSDCYSYILAENVKATEPYPTFPASVKDGYAVIANDAAFSSKERSILTVIGIVTAGFNPDIIVTPGTCARVSTGGIIPAGADAVVQVEDTCVHSTSEEDEVSIEVLKKPELYQDIRAVGSDVAKDQILIPHGKKITAAEIGIMSTYGITCVSVYQKPSVAVMSTGDEVVEPDSHVTPGCIRDSNKNALIHLLIENCIPFTNVGIAKDNPTDVKLHLLCALNNADIIISTGGVSMGEKDVLKQVLEEDFQAIIHYGRVHMKPGKPTTFSTVVFNDQKKFIFSLPGNPVSAYVCFYLFVIPCIKKLMGYTVPEHQPIKVKLGHDIKLDERPEFYRVRLIQGEDGVFIAEGTGGQQSSRLLSMQNADALLVLPPKTEIKPVLHAGVFVNAILLKSI